MRVIFISQGHDRVRQVSLGRRVRALLFIAVLGLPLGIGVFAGYQWSGATANTEILVVDTTQQWSEELAQQHQSVSELRETATAQLSAIALRMAELQARLVRLDALGERLITMAQLDEGEFDFSQPPAVGGPETVALGEAYQAPEFIQVMGRLVEQIEDREQQLDTLEALMTRRKLRDDSFVAGRPIRKGWLSSYYGRRTDPFNGTISWHDGVDFAAKPGSDIISVAAGVVVEAGERTGYGGFVEIDHGSGLKTRYAHTRKNLVQVGDIVKKGQTIALIGNTGRSTGPHVHFEVFKNGKTVDPITYIRRPQR